jgi:hypothetical protein
MSEHGSDGPAKAFYVFGRGDEKKMLGLSRRGEKKVQGNPELKRKSH